MAVLDAGELPAELGVLLSALPKPLAGALPADEALRQLVGLSRSGQLRQVLALLDPHLHELYPAGQETLAQATPLPDGYPAVTLARAIAAALAAPPVGFYRGQAGDPFLIMAEPRALLFSPDHLEAAGSEALPRVRFEAARTLARVAAGSTVGHVLAPETVKALFQVTTDATADGPGYRELRKRLGSVLPRKVRKEIERVLEEAELGDARHAWATWDEEERRRSLRVALVVSSDMRVIVQALVPRAAVTPAGERRKLLAASPAMVDLLRFAASDACWAAQRKVYG